MPRPELVPGEPKSVRLTVALSEDEARAIKRTAADNGMGVSAFIREILVGFSD